MKQYIQILSLITALTFTAYTAASQPFEAWKKQCEALPSLDTNNSKTPLTAQAFLQQLNTFTAAIRTEQTNAHWVGNIKPSYTATFNPFIQKVVVPAGSKIAFHGDLHGDVHSLNHFIAELIEKKYLNAHYKIIDPTFYMAFLGDYTDRGTHGAEVLSTIMHLKAANPDKVFLVRGNHEDTNINNGCGFYQELKTKYGKDAHTLYKHIASLYNLLPAALYLGTQDTQTNVTNYIQCCHGGIESRVNPQPLLQSKHNNAYGYIDTTHLRTTPAPASLQKLLKNHLNTPFTTDNGFMWGDFAVNPNDKTRSTRGTCCAFQTNKQDTDLCLASISTKSHKVCGFFRAHQHGDPAMDKLILSYPDAGVSKLWGDKKNNIEKLWDGIVCTFSVAPAAYKSRGYTQDHFGILTTASHFKDWRLKMFGNYTPSNYTYLGYGYNL